MQVEVSTFTKHKEPSLEFLPPHEEDLDKKIKSKIAAKDSRDRKKMYIQLIEK